MILKRAVGIAIRDDSLGKNLTHTGHEGDFRPVRLVDIDLEFCQIGLDEVNFNKPPVMGGLPGPVSANGQQGQEEKKRCDGLIPSI